MRQEIGRSAFSGFRFLAEVIVMSLLRRITSLSALRRVARMRCWVAAQNLGWAVGYNTIALLIATGVLAPAFGLVLRPEFAALAMSGSTIIVAVNALTLKRLRLPVPDPAMTRSPDQTSPSSLTSAEQHTDGAAR